MSYLVPLLLSLQLACANPVPTPVDATTPTLSAGGSAGQRAPSLTVTDHLGQSLVLEELLAKGPVMLVFYRGHW